MPAASPTTQPSPRWKTRAFWQRMGLIALISWVALALLLWLGGPPLLKRALPWLVAEQLQLQAQVDDIRVNPLTGELRVQGLRISDHDEPLLAIEHIRVNASLASLWRGSISFDAIALEGPDVNVHINQDGELNLLKLVPPSDPHEPPSGALRWAIDEFLLDRGRVHFRADHLQPAVDVQLQASRIQVQDLRSYGEKPGQINLSTRLQDDTELTWQAQLDLAAMRSEGTLSIKHLPLTSIQELLPMVLPVRATQGKLSLSVPYQAAIEEGQARVAVNQGQLSIDTLATALTNSQNSPLQLPILAVSGIDLRWPEHTVAIEAISAERGELLIERDRRGRLLLAQAFANTSPAASTPTPPPAADAVPWQVTIGKLSLKDWQAQWLDHSTRPSARIALTPLTLNLGTLSWPEAQAVPLALQAALGDGQLAINGQLDMLAPAVDLHIVTNDLPLALAQPYIAQQLAVKLTRGTAYSDLQLRWDAQKPDLALTGELGLKQLNVLSKLDGSRLLGAQRLHVAGLDAQPEQQKLSIANVLADGLYSQIRINKEQQLNLSQLVVEQPNKPASKTRPAQASAKPMRIRVGQVRVQRSAMLFADQSMTPGFATGIEKLKGSITSLDSRDVANARVKLSGVVAPAGKVSIEGKMNPLARDLSLDMALQFRELELAALTPYAARFAGYSIDRGKLDLDLRYLIAQRELQAENKVMIRQLRLGDKVDSPEAIGIPLKLAVAILRDVDDNIGIDLPISGSLDNPEFSVGPVIWKAFVNLLMRAATAPFSLLANLAGGDADLSNVAFALGSSVLSDTARDNLGKLANAIVSRPSLQLEVRGLSDAQADRKALQLQKVEAELALRQQNKARERLDALERYLRDVGSRSEVNRLKDLSQVPDANGKLELNAVAYELRLLDALTAYHPISDEALTQLAQQRAQAIADALLTQFNIPPARVFLLDPQKGQAQDDQLLVPLSLTAG